VSPRLRTALARWLPPLGLWTFAWLLLSTMLYLLLANETRMVPHLGEVVAGQGMRVLLWIAFSFGVRVLWRRFPLESWRAVGSLGVHLFASLLSVFLSYYLRVLLFGGWEQLSAVVRGDGFALGGTNFWDAVIYWGVIAYLAVRESRERELEVLRHQAALQTSMAAAELRALKYQLQPHFLYNALNAVVALIKHERYDHATETLATLGSVLRALTDGPSREFVRLDEELAFLEKLLSIEQVRFGDKLTYAIDAPPELHDASVPSFILQPLVENAVKHGIGRLLGPGRIAIRARATDGGRLRLEVENDTPPAVRPPADDQLLSGVGLSATRSRLRHHYNGTGAMRCDLFSGPRALVALEFPLTRLPPP
jgi:two-component system LytT family sensor kinase